MKNEIKDRIISDIVLIIKGYATRMDISCSEEGVLGRVDLPVDLEFLHAAVSAVKEKSKNPKGVAFLYFQETELLKRLRYSLESLLNGWVVSIALPGGLMNNQIMDAAFHLSDLLAEAKRRSA